ncbi:hypothetical protein HZS_4041 [Henneguya salminicola]|nr:hypothetical protein HZS_4041 [Henneguya salminicola]
MCDCDSSFENYLVTGANRGLGLGLVKEILEQHKPTKVIATVRNLDDCTELKELKSKYKNLYIYKLGIL